MKLQKIFVGLALLLVGIAFGMAFSDYAVKNGFPHDKFFVKLVHEDTREGDYSCLERSRKLGPNLSLRGDATLTQSNCVVEVIGERLADGSISVVPVWTTWRGRLFEPEQRTRISKERILEIVQVPPSL